MQERQPPGRLSTFGEGMRQQPHAVQLIISINLQVSKTVVFIVDFNSSLAISHWLH